MRHRAFMTSVLLISIACIAALATAEESREIKRTFDTKERIRLKATSGECVIERSRTGKIEISVLNDIEPSDAFEAKFRERGSVLDLEEDIDRDTHGRSIWTIGVPDGIEIEFSSASGGMEISGVSGEFEASTASGDFELKDCSGEFKLSTASGNYDVRAARGTFRLSSASGDHHLTDCSGDIKVSTASGDVDAEGIELAEESSFSTASGSVHVTLAKTAAYDLSLGSASGHVTLDYNGNPLSGTFEFTVKKRGGRIVSPYDFDDVEEFERGDDLYVRKTFTKGNDAPNVSLGSASGKAVLKK